MNVLLTGATGFVGKALIAELASQDVGIVVAVRHLVQELPEDVLQVKIGDLFELESAQALQGVDTVIHCAARAHVIKSYVADPLAESSESLFLRKLVLGIPAQASGKNLTRPLMPSAPQPSCVHSFPPHYR